MPEGYSAGSIFLQVVPSFLGFQEAVGKKVKETNADIARQIGDTKEIEAAAERSGAKTGDKYAGAFATRVKTATKSLERELDNLKVGLDDKGLMADLEKVRGQIKALGNEKIGVSISSKQAELDIAAILADIARVRKQAGDIGLDFNLAKGSAQLEALRAQVRKLNDEKVTIKPEFDDKYIGRFRTDVKTAIDKLNREIAPIRVRVEDKDFQAKFAALKRDAAALSQIDVGVHMTSGEADAKLAELQAGFEALRAEAGNLEVKTNIDEALRGLAAYRASIEALNQTTIEPDIKVEDELKKAEIQFGAFTERVRASLKKATDSLGDGVGEQVAEIRAKIESLRDIRVGVDLSTTEFLFEVEQVTAALHALDSESVDVAVKADVASALKSLAEIYAAARAIGAESPVVEVDADTVGADRKILGSTILARLLGQISPHIQVSADTARADAQLTKTGLLAKLLGSKLLAGNSASSFRAFSGILLLVTSLGTALIPIIAALTAGFLALGPAVMASVAGFGILVLVLAPVVNALQALSQQSKSSARDSETASNAVRNAAQSIADAERSLTRARQDAARSAADAARAVVDAKRQEAQGVASAIEQERQAQESYANSVQDVQNAEEALREARLQAQRDQEDLKNQIKQNAIDQRQAEVELFNATVAYRATQNDGSATNLDKYQALTRLQQARLSMSEARQQGTRLQQAATNPNDPNSPQQQVQSAQDALTQAIQAQQDAEEALGRAAKAVDQARINGARQVADAIRQQQRTAQDNARAISDAQRNLTRAQENYQEVLHSTGDIGSASMSNVKAAMAKLSPAGQQFVRFLFGLRGELKQLRGAADPLFGGMTDAIKMLNNKYFPGLKNFITNMSRAMANLFRDLGKALTGKDFQQFFSMLNQLGPHLITDFGKATIDWLKIFAQLMVIAAPWASKLSDAILGISKHVLKWINSKAGIKLISDFFKYAAKVAPSLEKFMEALGRAIVAIGIALAPIGDKVIKALTYVLNWIANLSPKDLTTILGVIAGIILAFQIWTGVTAVLAGSMFGLILVAGVLVGALILTYNHSKLMRDIVNSVIDVFKKFKPEIIGIGIAIGVLAGLLYTFYLYEKLSIAMTKAYAFILRAWAAATKIATAVQAAFNFVMDANPVMLVVLAIAALVAGIIIAYKTSGTFRKIVNAVFSWLKGAVVFLINFVKDHWQTILAILTGPIGLFALFVYKHWDTIKGYFIDAKDWIVNTFVGLWHGALDKISGALSGLVNDIKDIWNKLKAIFEAPISFVIDTVLNGGLIKAFNWIADKVPGLPSIPNIPNPFHQTPSAPPGHSAQHMGGFARGGIAGQAFAGTYPGYTPGRDIGTIHVSGGEAVMRPEWTKAIMSFDPSYIDRMNYLARQGGVDAVRRYMGAFRAPHFALGGVVGDWERVTWRGHEFDGYTIKKILEAEQYLGRQMSILQGSFSTSVAASGGTHAGGGAVDIGSPLTTAAVAAMRRALFAAWRRFPSQGPWPNHIHGIAIGDKLASPSAKQQVIDFLHGGDGLGGPDYGPQVGLAGALGESWVGKALGSVLSFARGAVDALSHPIDYIEGKLKAPLAALESKFGGPDGIVVRTVEALPPYILGKAKDWILGAVEGFIGTPAINRTKHLAGTAPQGVAAIRNMIDTYALNRYGWTGQQIADLNKIVAAESGFNPLAKNPSSSAYGLFQFLDSTWAAMGGVKTSDPRIQTMLGLSYIAKTYGTPERAWQFHLDHGWYAQGGVVPEDGESDATQGQPSATLFDTGGWLQHGQMALNLSGAPEPVFTNEQWDTLRNGGGMGDTTITVPVAVNASPNDVAAAIEFAVRKRRIAGPYGRRP